MANQYNIGQLFKTSWSELTINEKAQLIQLRFKLNEAHKERLYKSYGYMAIAILRLLRKNKTLVAKINIEQAIDCLHDLSFINTSWYDFPEVKLNGYQKPDDHFTNITYAQFAYADRAFSKFLIETYHKRNGLHYLNLLCAALYTTTFDDKKLDEQANEIGKHVSLEARTVIFQTFANTREFLINKYTSLFTKPTETEEQESIKKPPIDTGSMWQSLWFSLAETPVFQGFENAGRSNVYTALTFLDKKAFENLNQKQTHAQM